jgi:hypothetical protein
MIMGFEDLQLAVVLGEEFFDKVYCLIIHDVSLWFKPFCC